jgi:hypothetical protein
MRRPRVRHHTSDTNLDDIQVGKELVLRLFCLSCQGYRSLHRALQEGYWPAFQAYYTSEKREAVRRLVDRLIDLTPRSCREYPPPRSEELFRITPSLGLFRALFGRWLGKRKQNWGFTMEEIRFLTSTLQRLLKLLERPEAPPGDELIALQIDLCNCSGIIEMHCYGLPELERARYIEHFDQTETVQHWQLWEVLGEPVPVSRSGGPATKAAG